MSKRKLYIAATLLTCALVVAGFFLGGQSTSAQSKPTSSSQKPEVSTAVKYDLSPPLTEMIARQQPIKNNGQVREINEGFSTDRPAINKGYSGDGALQRGFGLTSPLIPSPVITFSGIPNTFGVSPPDPVGDVSANYYVQMVNLGFQIYDKNGVALTAVANTNTLWAGFGGPCQTENAGDPIVLHDQLADRWLLTQFTDTGAPFFNCVAVSQTSDPRGAYHRYAFSTPSFPDYPKYGVWPDAYYINTRESGIGVLGNIALERDLILVGNPAARQVRFTTSETSPLGQGLLPSDLDGAVLPPAGSPNYFVGTQDNDAGAASDAVLLYKFHVDWANTANSTFTGPTILPAAPFDSIFPCTPGSRDCIPQPGTSARLDILSYRQRPTFRLAYRNYLSHESLVTSQSVEAQPGVAGMRWYELRSPNTTPVIFQQGTYSPDTTIHRWMGSIAMDGSGNMALGYSVSNGTNVFPGIRYTGRLASDPLGTMPQGEGIMINGTGSQTNSPRWGDYTSMNVDPSDDCTFWYTNEYVPTTSAVGWRGGVGAFRFPGCTAAGGTPTPTVTGTPPTNTPTRTATITPLPTSTVPASPTPCNITTVLNEGFEAGTLGAFTQTVIITSTTTPVPTPGWASVASNPHSGTRSAFAPDPDRTTDSRLATINNINIPAGVSTATLTFWHRFAFENLFDGGVLEVSTDGGTTWADADANIQQGGYNGTITVFQGCVTAGTPPPWPNGKRVWTSSQTTYGQVRVNLLPYQGTNMKFRFRLGTDCSVSNTGWNVDDVVVSYGTSGGCATVTGTPPTAPPTAPPTSTVTAGTAVVSPTVCSTTPVNLVLDDGTVENSVGWTNSTMNFTAIWINRASPPAASFPMNLTNMSIKWPNSAALVGKTIALLVYSDADGDGDPSDAVKVAQVNGQTITVANGTTFQDFPINVNIPTAGDVYFGFADTYNSGGVSPRTFPAPLDTTATQGRSWVAAMDGTADPDFDNLGNNDNLGTIDTLSGGALAGNWVIRASGTGGGGCVTGTPVSTSVASTTPMVSPTVCVGSTQLVVDGSFEGGSPSSTWTEKSTNFGTPLCNSACGSGGGTAGPRTGDWWAWFGGTSDAEDGAVSQTVNIPAGGATLSFYLWLGAHSGGGTSDFLRVLVGGTEVFRADDTSTAYDAGYTLVTVPVAATGSVILRFEEHNEAGTGVINFSVDDVSLTAGGNCPTGTPGATNTAVPSSTTAPPTSTSVPTSTATTGVVATVTSVPATSTTVPPTVCPLEFTDVPTTNEFYPFIKCLVCRFIISGYNDGTFRPNNNIVRGQIAKMVSNSAGFSEPAGSQIYEDVPPSNEFYEWINRLTMRGVMGGYPCGSNVYEPCGPQNRPYFRWNANATRGQLAQIVARGAGLTDPPGAQRYTDVPSTNTFFVPIQQLSNLNVMGGYPCGGVNPQTGQTEPCDPQNRPYFRPNNTATRAQASKIVANTFFPGCIQSSAADGKSDSPFARNPNGKQSDPLRLTSSQDARNGR